MKIIIFLFFILFINCQFANCQFANSNPKAGPWSYDAWNWLCKTSSDNTNDNYDIANFIATELTIAHYDQARFSVYVGDINSKIFV